MKYISTNEPEIRYAYSIGIALTLPFYKDLVPLQYAILLLLLLPFLISQIRKKEIKLYTTGIGAALSICIILALSNLIALGLSETPFKEKIIKEIFFLLPLISLYCLCPPKDRKNITKGFFDALIILAATTATIGLVKLFLQDRGYLIGFIINACPDLYPRGSSVCADYNITGMLYLIAIIGIIKKITQNGHWLWILTIAIITSSGIQLGSRRFLVLLPIVLVYFLAVTLMQRKNIKPTKLTIKTSLIIALTAVLSIAIPNEKLSNYFKNENEPYKVLRISQSITNEQNENLKNEAENIDPNKSTEASLSDNSTIDKALPIPNSESNQPKYDNSQAEIGSTVIRDNANLNARPDPQPLPPTGTSPAHILGTISPNSFFGLISRLGRWSQAIDLSQANNYLPMGFAYHAQYSCSSANVCDHIDYPHSPILSALLIGSLPLAALTISLYLLVAWRIFTSSTNEWLNGIPAAALVSIPYSFISGDTIVSLPHFIIISIILIGMRGSQVDRPIAA